MRKVLFYSWCIGGMTLYGFAMRAIVRGIAETYGLAAMGIAVAGFIWFCWTVARRMDRRAGRRLVDRNSVALRRLRLHLRVAFRDSPAGLCCFGRGVYHPCATR